jgi:hypothetical protein
MDFFSGKIIKALDEQTFDIAINYQRVGNKQKYSPLERVHITQVTNPESIISQEELIDRRVGVYVVERQQDMIMGKLRLFQCKEKEVSGLSSQVSGKVI